jgi:hypothetical protein
MTSRKVAPIERQIKKPLVASGLTQEYLEAVKLLSAETMNMACSFAISDASDSSDKLLSLYSKCEKAVDIVNRDAPTDLPKMPGLNMMQKRDSLTTTARPPGTMIRGSMPLSMSGGKMMGPTAAKTFATKGRMMRPPAVPMRGKISRLELQHADSESSLDNMTQQRGKTQRTAGLPPPPRNLSPINHSSSAAATQSVKAPPPSALSFLAKLNKDKGAARQETTKPRRPSPKNDTSQEEKPMQTNTADEEEEEDLENEMEVEQTEEATLPKEEPTRRQPTRSSRRK